MSPSAIKLCFMVNYRNGMLFYRNGCCFRSSEKDRNIGPEGVRELFPHALLLYYYILSSYNILLYYFRYRMTVCVSGSCLSKNI
jgi:hypothetical protein